MVRQGPAYRYAHAGYEVRTSPPHPAGLARLGRPPSPVGGEGSEFAGRPKRNLSDRAVRMSEATSGAATREGPASRGACHRAALRADPLAHAGYHFYEFPGFRF